MNKAQGDSVETRNALLQCRYFSQLQSANERLRKTVQKFYVTEDRIKTTEDGRASFEDCTPWITRLDFPFKRKYWNSSYTTYSTAVRVEQVEFDIVPDTDLGNAVQTSGPQGNGKTVKIANGDWIFVEDLRCAPESQTSANIANETQLTQVLGEGDVAQ